MIYYLHHNVNEKRAIKKRHQGQRPMSKRELQSRTYAVQIDTFDLDFAMRQLQVQEIALAAKVGVSKVNHEDGDNYDRKKGRTVAAEKMKETILSVKSVHVQHERISVLLEMKDGKAMFMFVKNNKNGATRLMLMAVDGLPLEEHPEIFL